MMVFTASGILIAAASILAALLSTWIITLIDAGISKGMADIDGMAIGAFLSSVLAMTYDRCDVPGFWRAIWVSYVQAVVPLREHDERHPIHPGRRIACFIYPLATSSTILVLAVGITWAAQLPRQHPFATNVQFQTYFTLCAVLWVVSMVYAYISRKRRLIAPWTWQSDGGHERPAGIEEVNPRDSKAEEPAKIRTPTSDELVPRGDERSFPESAPDGDVPMSAKGYLYRRRRKHLKFWGGMILAGVISFGVFALLGGIFGGQDLWIVLVIVSAAAICLGFIGLMFTLLLIFTTALGYDGLPWVGSSMNYCCPRCMRVMTLDELYADRQTTCPSCGQQFKWQP